MLILLISPSRRLPPTTPLFFSTPAFKASHRQTLEIQILKSTVKMHLCINDRPPDGHDLKTPWVYNIRYNQPISALKLVITMSALTQLGLVGIDTLPFQESGKVISGMLFFSSIIIFVLKSDAYTGM